ncbi:hypothetical protein SLS62_007275 [Diatrype stigma]|uniref:Uncharacterized protein n=1 Tax=Diatrype stigma TaxID=117547 RepID=A0AAN9YQV0_9PEZI
MQDGMLVAETVLYSDLHQKLSRHSYLGDSGEGDEFVSWRQKWEYLWALPTSSMMKLGYHAACLILSLRGLEESGGALQPQTFLSDDADTGSDNGQESTDFSHERAGEKCYNMRAHACKHAKLVLETILKMPPSLSDSVPTCLCLCIGYCALLLAHYDESQSRITEQDSLDVINRIDEWIRHAPGKAWSFKYGDLARRKVEARISKAKRADSRDLARHGGAHQATRIRPGLQEHASGLDTPAGDSVAEVRDELGESGVYHAAEWIPQEQSFDPTTAVPGFEHSPFPSLEYYFGGGFYDFTK